MTVHREPQATRAAGTGGDDTATTAYLDHAYRLDAIAGEVETGEEEPEREQEREPSPALPLDDEAFVPVWRSWSREAAERGAWAVLAEHLPQLAFPVAEGMSADDDYRAATGLGRSPDGLAAATGLGLERPEALELTLHPSAAGTIPILRTAHRPDFVLLVQALAHRNEPAPIPPRQGAAFVSGYIDWTRVAQLRRRWEETPPEERQAPTWGAELARSRPRKSLYQDRFLILSEGPYSGVAAAEIGVEAARWRRRSAVLRREHELVHYLTRRLFGAIHSHALDELAADYAGMVAALDGFEAATWRRFVGLGADGSVAPGARLEIYRGGGDARLADGALEALGPGLVAAADAVETAHRELLGADPSPVGRAAAVLAILTTPLAALGGPDGAEALGRSWRAVRRRFGLSVAGRPVDDRPVDGKA